MSATYESLLDYAQELFECDRVMAAYLVAEVSKLAVQIYENEMSDEGRSIYPVLVGMRQRADCRVSRIEKGGLP